VPFCSDSVASQTYAFRIMEHPKKHEPTEEEWRELARLATKEEDPEKVINLARQIIQKFDEEERQGLRPV
jgi:hypothetical protein